MKADAPIRYTNPYIAAAWFAKIYNDIKVLLRRKPSPAVRTNKIKHLTGLCV